MKICNDCPFKKEAELYCDGEQMKKICKYQAICERAVKNCIHNQVQWEHIAQDFPS